MAQQINLLTPVLMVPKRYFSALALVQALGLLALGGAALAMSLFHQAEQARTSYAAENERGRQERIALQQALARLPAQGDPKLMEQDLQSSQQLQVQLQAQLDELQAGRTLPGQAHSDLLRLLAQQTPNGIWLSQLRWQQGRLELEGRTLDPDALNAWLQRIHQHPMLKGLTLQAIKVEAEDARQWRFSVLSQALTGRPPSPAPSSRSPEGQP